MNKNYSVQELSKLYVEIGKKTRGADYAYPWALGTIIGIIDHNIKYRPNELERIINERYAQAEKELASL